MPQTPEPETLDGRTQSILTAIVHCFIQNAEPIGSRTISKRFDFGLSPATIRNVMSDLEDLGFLEQPHTSAGRIPTDKGYRFYVNHLSDVGAPSSEDSARISQRYTLYRGEVGEVMAETSRLLSEVTQYAGVVLRTFTTTIFKRIEFVKIRDRQVMAIFVMESGMIQNKLIMLDEELSQDDLHRISNYLNHEFANQPLRDIRLQVLERMNEEKAQYDSLVQQAMNVGEKTFGGAVESESDVYLGGTVNILDQPEFASNVDQMKDLFAAFEEKSRLISVLDKCLEETGVNVVIGSETPFKDIHECSFVTPHLHLCRSHHRRSRRPWAPSGWPIHASWALSITPRNSSAESSPRAERPGPFDPHPGCGFPPISANNLNRWPGCSGGTFTSKRRRKRQTPSVLTWICWARRRWSSTRTPACRPATSPAGNPHNTTGIPLFSRRRSQGTTNSCHDLACLQRFMAAGAGSEEDLSWALYCCKLGDLRYMSQWQEFFTSLVGG